VQHEQIGALWALQFRTPTQERFMKAAFKSVLYLLALAPLVAWSHTSVSDSTPKSGSELTESPATIEISFHDGAKLTSLAVVGADKQERKLAFVASDKPNTFRVNDPKLAPGLNEIQWKALSKDGHVASGKLTYTIKTAAKAH
jgi:copper resistance protein C